MLSWIITRWHKFRTGCSYLAHLVRTNPTLAAITVEGFLTRFGFGMIGFALPLYAVSLGMSLAEIGVLYAIRTLVTVVFKPLMGWVADRFGSKLTLVIAVAMRCVIGFLFIFSDQPWHLYVLRILHGVMTAARDPSATSLIAENGKQNRMASAFAWYLTARDVGRSLGYGVAGILIALASYQVVFSVAFVASCAALFTVKRYVRSDVQRAAHIPKRKDTSVKAVVPAEDPPVVIEYRHFIGYASFGMMVTLTSEMMRGLFPVIAVQYAHLTEMQAGITAMASSIAILFAGPFFGWLADNVDRKLSLSFRGIANIFSSLFYLFMPNFPGFLTARVLDDTGKAAFRPAWGSVLAEISAAKPTHRGRIIAVVDSGITLGEMLGPLLAGVLVAAFGVPAMLGVRVLLAVITEIQALIVFRKK